MPLKSPGAFTLHAAIDRKHGRHAVAHGKIPDWTIFAGICLALAVFAIAVGEPPDPSGFDLSP
jgi:hypothetical protein